ncbi:MAG: sodium:solute symporter family protein [Candidatus Babeliales bacterium]
MDMIFAAVFIIFGIIYLIIGAYASKNIETSSDYFLAGRSLGFIPVTFTLIATQLGGGMMLGSAQKAYEIGYYGILYTLGMSIGFLILASGIAGRLQELNVSTTAQLFETHYGSTALKKWASLLSIITLGGLLLGQIVASKTLLAGLGFTNEGAFLLFWIFIIAYTVMGGLKAVVWTDIFQVLFIIITFGGICLYTIATSFSWHQALTDQTLFSTVAISHSSLLATFLMPILFALIEQDLAQRFFSARSKEVALRSALASAIFMIVFALIPIYFGMQTKILNLALPAGANPLLPSLAFFTNPLIFVFAICALVAAFTSTADSLLCAMSSNIAQDFNIKLGKITNEVTIGKIITLVAGLIIIASSYIVTSDIIDILIKSYELSVSCLFVPLIYSYFYTNLNKNGAWGSTIAGLTLFIISLIWPFAFSDIITLIGSWIGYKIGNKFSAQ